MSNKTTQKVKTFLTKIKVDSNVISIYSSIFEIVVKPTVQGFPVRVSSILVNKSYTNTCVCASIFCLSSCDGNCIGFGWCFAKERRKKSIIMMLWKTQNGVKNIRNSLIQYREYLTKETFSKSTVREIFWIYFN